MSLIYEWLKWNRFGLQSIGGRTGDNPCGAGNSRHRGAVLDSMRNFEREFLAVGGVLGVLRFGRIGQEAALHQH